MALPYPAAPQSFTFGGRQLFGFLTGFSGSTPRRGAVQEYLKRPGATVDDMERGPRSLEVELVFSTEYRSPVTQSAASAYQQFEAAIAANPFGLLIHPIAGRWSAFCWGPQPKVDFARAIDEISVRVRFTEAALDQTIIQDAPDVATAAQDVTTKQTAYQSSVADYMGLIAKGSDIESSARVSIDEALGQVSLVEAPIDLIRETISNAQGIQSAVIGTILSIATKAELLNQAIDDYVTSTSDLFDGSDPSSAEASQASNLLGAVLAAGDIYEDAVIAVSSTPAGAAEAVGSTEELVASCLVLDAAIKAARPPTIVFVAPELMSLIPFCQLRYQRDAEARAADIMSMNRLLNPHAIPAGTRLLIPAR